MSIPIPTNTLVMMGLLIVAMAAIGILIAGAILDNTHRKPFRGAMETHHPTTRRDF